MTDPKYPDKWLSLAQIRERLPSGSWRHTPVFEQIGVAVERNWSPTEFWSLSEWDQANIIAYYRANGTIQAYNDHLVNEDAKKRK